MADLSELKARALDYADMTGSEFPDSDRVANYVNTALSELHELLTNVKEDYSLTIKSYTLISGTETYALPANFLKALKVFYVSGDRRYRLRRFSLDDVDGYRAGPIAGGTVELWYVPELTPLLVDDDKVDDIFPVGWVDFVAVSAAIRLLGREESDTTWLQNERELLRQRITSTASERDIGDADDLGDYYNRWNHAALIHGNEDRNMRYRIMGKLLRLAQFEHLGA